MSLYNITRYNFKPNRLFFKARDTIKSGVFWGFFIFFCENILSKILILVKEKTPIVSLGPKFHHTQLSPHFLLNFQSIPNELTYCRWHGKKLLILPERHTYLLATFVINLIFFYVYLYMLRKPFGIPGVFSVISKSTEIYVLNPHSSSREPAGFKKHRMPAVRHYWMGRRSISGTWNIK